jgi:small-conductance mechanosensitive channel
MAIPLAVVVNVGDSLETALNAVFNFLPQLLAALLILLVGWIIARILRSLIAKLLGKLEFDRRLGSTKAGGVAERFSPGGSVTRLIGGFIYWVTMIGVFSLALTALEIQEVTDIVGAFYEYLPNVIAALLILILAALGGQWVGAFIRTALGDEGTGRLLSQIVPILILVLASFMILVQLKIAPSIVIITYSALVGAVALAAAIAFGLGARDVAAKISDEMYNKRNGSGGGSA